MQLFLAVLLFFLGILISIATLQNWRLRTLRDSCYLSLTCVHLSPSIPNARAWSSTSSRLFSVKSFFMALSNTSYIVPFSLTKFIWNLKSHLRSSLLLGWGHARTNNMLQLRKPFKSPSPDRCILCEGSGKSINHLFLHYPITLGLQHYLFRQVKIDWVLPRSVCMIISYSDLRSSFRGKTHWQIACLILLWIVW